MKKIIKRIYSVLLGFVYRVKVIYSAEIYYNNKFEGENSIQENSKLSNCYVGKASYVGANCEFDSVKIGRFCAIGNDVKVIAANHPTEKFVSIHPAFYSKRSVAISYVKEQRFEEFKRVDDAYAVHIGNDVWIGDGVKILGGTRIGDGAIVGTGAVVTKDVAPYSIIGGVPAKKIRMRFSDKEISFLLSIKWWNKDEKWIREHAELFQDIRIFCDKIEK